MHQTLAINIRPEDRDSIPLIRKIIEILESKSIKILLPEYKILQAAELSGYIVNEKIFLSQAEIVISVGGDGTLLHTVRLFPEKTPIFGINKGRLGFLTEFMPDEALKYMDNIINKDYAISDRNMLDVIHIRNKEEISRIPFLNDAAIYRGIYSRPITIFFDIDNKFLNSFSGDGLIVSTSTGSTGYSLSAGGPIITPSIKDLFMLMPVCPHSLAMRPLIIPGNSILKVTIGSAFVNTVMTVDGHESINIEGSDEIYFSESKRKALLIAHPEKNFYEILKEKFNWGT